MKQRYYQVRDIVAGSYIGSPVPMPNDETAKRALRIEAQNPEAFKGQREDIELWYLFTLDTDSGKVIDNTPDMIGRLVDYVGKVEDEQGK